MYNVLSALPVPTAAQFTSPSSLQISFTIRDHVRNAQRTIVKGLTLPDLVATGFVDVPSDAVVSLTSPSKLLRAILRETKTNRFVEVWSGDRLVAHKDVTSQHGQFYSDGMYFSSVFISSTTFSPSETSLLYVAEQNSPTVSPDDPFTKFRYRPSFGEGLAKFRQPAIFVLSWSVSDSQKAPQLYQLSIPTLGRTSVSIQCTAEKLTPPHLSCRSPRLFTSSKGPTLVYLSRNAGGPHGATHALHVLPLATLESLPSQPTVLVPIVDDPAPNSFPGLYPPYSLAKSFLIHHEEWNAPKIVIHSTWGSRNTLLFIDTLTGTVTDVTPIDEYKWSWSLLTTDGRNRIICARSSPSIPYQVLLGTVSVDLSVEWNVVHKPELSEDTEAVLSSLKTDIMAVPNRHPVEVIIIRQPKLFGTQNLPPCILMPHGGPHGTSTSEFSPMVAALVLEGYTLALPNYTGSLGFGQSAVLRLLGKCGSLDTDDCMKALQHIVDLGYAQFGKGKLFIHGGSHGGFLGAHLIGQFPDVFTAVALRNPVVSAGEMTATTDIPDWCYVEFGIPYFASKTSSLHLGADGSAAVDEPYEGTSVAPAIYQKLYNASPIRLVDKVLADVLLLVGKDDLRAPPSQGYGYYHALKALQNSGAKSNGQRVEMLVFDGESHPLEGVECARVCWEASKAWFAEAASREREN
ncbi:Alpha/Beta hydrolase fold [Amanita muscaria]